MFTGLVQAVGRIAALEMRGGDCRMHIGSGTLDMRDAAVGDSICVDGVCLTATELTRDGFWCDVSNETLSCTTLGRLREGDAVNLEASLRPTTQLGGHFVSGHVDGVGRVRARKADGRSVRFKVEVPAALARYVAAKGSICLDGVSLTVNAVKGRTFDVNIVPHTQEQTTLKAWDKGTEVNVEVDLVARYVERLLVRDEIGDDKKLKAPRRKARTQAAKRKRKSR